MATITLSRYDSAWPAQFERISNIIRTALGPACLAVHHIGSTAVPGLAAKPKIDSAAVLARGSDPMDKLEAAGFTYRGPWNHPLKWGFVRRGEIDVNVHVFEEGDPEIDLKLLFRDTLRALPDLRKAYSQLKCKFAAETQSATKPAGSIFSRYTLKKYDFIKKILQESRFSGQRFLFPSHADEKAAYARITKYGIDVPIAERKLADYSLLQPSDSIYRFLLTLGIEPAVIGQACADSQGLILETIKCDPEFQNQGLEAEIFDRMTRWAQRQESLGHKSARK